MLPMDDIPCLRAFVCIAEYGSFSKAADALHITQPAVSKRIALLEENLSEKLFDRLGRQIILTETGQVLLPKCRQILESIQDAELLINNLGGKVTGVLKLGTSHHIGLHHLAPVLRKFGQRYADVELELHFMGSEQVCEKVLSADLDIGIITLPLTTPPLIIAKPIWTDKLLAVVGNDHVLASHSSVNLKTLATFNALLPEKDTVTFKIIEQLFSDNHLTLATKLSTNYLETIKTMVSVGLGWSVLPHTMVDNDLTVLNVTGFNLTRKLGYIQHQHRTASNATLAMMGLLHELK